MPPRFSRTATLRRLVIPSDTDTSSAAIVIAPAVATDAVWTLACISNNTAERHAGGEDALQLAQQVHDAPRLPPVNGHIEQDLERWWTSANATLAYHAQMQGTWEQTWYRMAPPLPQLQVTASRTQGNAAITIACRVCGEFTEGMFGDHNWKHSHSQCATKVQACQLTATSIAKFFKVEINPLEKNQV